MLAVGVHLLEKMLVQRSRHAGVAALGRPDMEEMPGQGLGVLARKTVDRVALGHVQSVIRMGSSVLEEAGRSTLPNDCT